MLKPYRYCLLALSLLTVLSVSRPSIAADTAPLISEQNGKLSGDFYQVPLSDIVTYIGAHYGIEFINEQMLQDQLVSLRFSEYSIQDLINRIFASINHANLYTTDNTLYKVLIFDKKSQRVVVQAAVPRAAASVPDDAALTATPNETSESQTNSANSRDTTSTAGIDEPPPAENSSGQASSVTQDVASTDAEAPPLTPETQNPPPSDQLATAVDGAPPGTEKTADGQPLEIPEAAVNESTPDVNAPAPGSE